MSRKPVLPYDIRQECLWIVRGYDRRVKAYHEARREIIDGVACGFADKKNGERVYRGQPANPDGTYILRQNIFTQNEKRTPKGVRKGVEIQALEKNDGQGRKRKSAKKFQKSP
ncbi:hypothetical protein OBV_43120 [Oscillibacter valericigenes Sjm18-20]|nr:hypothetical protein OBV_43120 [Oscillibacter valericigenes Sjm18-20]